MSLDGKNSTRCRLIVTVGLLLWLSWQPKANALTPPDGNQFDQPLPRLSEYAKNYYRNRLKQAVRLYYAGGYQAALPLFEEILLKVRSPVVLYWAGLCAYRADRPDLAVQHLQQLLSRHPDFKSAHLYLALAYADLGEEAKARAELTLARQHLDDAWKEVIARIDRHLRQREWRRLRALLHLQTGIHFDSNPAARPDIDFFPATGGTIRVGDKLEGWFSQTNVGADISYDVFRQGGLAWRGKLDYLANIYLNDDNGVDLGKQFDYQRWQISTGPSWQQSEFRTDAWVTGGQRFFGRDHLSSFFGVAPAVSFKVLPSSSLSAGYRFRYENFDQERGGQDFFQNAAFIGWQSVVANHVFTLAGNGGHRDADNGIYGYWEGGVDLSWSATWPLAVRSYMGVQYHHRNYDDPLRVVTSKNRQDNRFSSSLVVSKRFSHGIFVEARWDYFINQANIELYDYQRHIVGLNVGMDFDF